MGIIIAGTIFGPPFSVFGHRTGCIIFNTLVTAVWEYLDIKQTWFPLSLYGSGTRLWLPQILFSLQTVRVGISAVSENDITYHLELVSYDDDTRIIEPCCELSAK